MKRFAAFALLALAACASTPEDRQTPSTNAAAPAIALPAGVTMQEASWYSEQVRVAGRLFTPTSASDGAARPGVVLAPAWEATAESLDVYAAALAQQGIVALAIDYRGWGRSGAELYLGQRVDTYDKMRFSEQTPEIVFRRGRLDPEHQVQDIRNAITFLQSRPGIDRTRIGVLGVDIAGGHVISVMGMDTRAKAGVAVTPAIFGQEEPEMSYVPDKAMRDKMISLARNGAPPRTAEEARARNKLESELALGEYNPFWRLDAIPQTAAIRFIIAETDDKLDNMIHARAAARELKGPTDVQSLPGALHWLTPAQTTEAARLAAEWMKQRL